MQENRKRGKRRKTGTVARKNAAKTKYEKETQQNRKLRRNRLNIKRGRIAAKPKTMGEQVKQKTRKKQIKTANEYEKS